MQDLFFVQSRDRPWDFENQRQQAFETFTLRNSFLFERVETKTTAQEITMKISNEMNEVVSTTFTKRDRERDRERDCEQNEQRNERRDRDI